MKRLTGDALRRLQAEVLDRDGGCVVCGAWTDHPPHHVKYRSEGGKDVAENMVTLCPDCHYEVHHGSMTKLIQHMVNYSPKRTLQYIFKGIVNESRT